MFCFYSSALCAYFSISNYEVFIGGGEMLFAPARRTQGAPAAPLIALQCLDQKLKINVW